MRKTLNNKTGNEIQIGSRARLIFTDNLNTDLGVPALDPESVALTFTSPPYWNFVDYAESEGVGYEASYEGYLDSLSKLFHAVMCKTIPGGKITTLVCVSCREKKPLKW